MNAGDATTVGAGEDTGDSLMTIGESGVGSGTVAAGFRTAANSGVSFTTTLWSPVGSAGLSCCGPGGQGGITTAGGDAREPLRIRSTWTSILPLLE